eukprot:scaffold142686_cov31-Tisochrysis_lutea.AAC.5
MRRAACSWLIEACSASCRARSRRRERTVQNASATPQQPASAAATSAEEGTEGIAGRARQGDWLAGKGGGVFRRCGLRHVCGVRSAERQCL